MLDVTIEKKVWLEANHIRYNIKKKNIEIGRMAIILPASYSLISWEIPYCNGLMINYAYRGMGIGSFFVSEIQKQFNMPIGLLCSDDRVAFYERLDFKRVDRVNQYNQMEWRP